MPVGARPPCRSVASRRHLLRGEGPIQGRVPLGGYLRGQRRQIVEAWESGFPGTVRAAASMLGAGGHGRLPHMAQLVPPPHPPVAVRGYGGGQQRSVLLWVPLGGDGRKLALQIVFPGYHQLSRTDGAARPATGPRVDLGLPCVSLGAEPPDLAGVSGHHIPRRQVTIFRGMPLLCQLRVGGCKVVDPPHQDPAGADGTTAAAQRAGFDDGLPFMALFADPPRFEMAPHSDALRRHRQVFSGMPLSQQIRSLGCQIIFPRPCLLPSAVGTPATLGAGIDRRLPCVPLGAQPPDLLPAAVGYLPWRQRPIFDRVPLSQQGQLVPLRAVIIERGPQPSSLPHHRINILPE